MTAAFRTNPEPAEMELPQPTKYMFKMMEPENETTPKPTGMTTSQEKKTYMYKMDDMMTSPTRDAPVATSAAQDRMDNDYYDEESDDYYGDFMQEQNADLWDMFSNLDTDWALRI